jgi:hypothetical protein
MARTPPEQIVAAVTALAADLADWCVEGRDRTLAAHETAVLERVRRILPLLLRAVVEVATSELDVRLRRAPQACRRCGRKAKPHHAQRRQVQTICGTLDLARPWYHCAACGHGWSAVETVLDVPARARLSAGLVEWVARLGAVTPFREAAEVLAGLTGLELGAETIRRHTERIGAALAAAEDATTAQVERTREPAESVASAPGLLVAQVDGAMVPFLDGWHEVKLGLVAGWEDGTLRAPSYVAAREPAGPFGARLAAEAARRGALEIDRWEGAVTGRGLARLRAAAILGDGAPWIWAVADERFDVRVEVVDAYHAYQHLHTAAKAAFGEGASAAAWAAARKGELLAQGVEPVLAALRGLTAPSAEAAEVVRVERGYFTKNAERMAYPTLRLDGLPLGSGGIESAADHLVQRRMKRAGMRWSDEGGRALLALRARLRSRRPIMVRPVTAHPRTTRRAAA